MVRGGGSGAGGGGGGGGCTGGCCPRSTGTYTGDVFCNLYCVVVVEVKVSRNLTAKLMLMQVNACKIGAEPSVHTGMSYIIQVI